MYIFKIKLLRNKRKVYKIKIKSHWAWWYICNPSDWEAKTEGYIVSSRPT
jgi:hypothetical protein